MLDRMQKGFAIIVVLSCAALMGRANEAPPTSFYPVLRTAGGFGAQQKIKCCAAKQQMVRSISDDGAYCVVMDDGV